MNSLSIVIDNLHLILDYYDKIKIYRANAESGPWDTELTDVDTRIDLIPEKRVYYFRDDTGTSIHWYKTSYYHSITFDESELSSARLGGTEVEKIGYSFHNYSPPADLWGKVLTADDIRHTFAWGIDMKASDVESSEVTDEQLDFVVENALAEFEHHFNIDIRKRVYKTRPADTLVQSPEWRAGVDYTDEEDPYDFNPDTWRSYGFLQLRHMPVISVESAKLYSAWDTKILDLDDWIRIYKKAGQLSIYPKGTTVFGTGYAGTGLIAAWPQLFGRKYPQGFRIDYTTGWKTSDFVDKDLRNAIGMLATLNLLGWMGDGLMAGFSSSSVSLDGLSESFSSTQSATSAFFGARILSYIKQLEKFSKTNRLKYGNIALGMIG